MPPLTRWVKASRFRAPANALAPPANQRAGNASPLRYVNRRAWESRLVRDLARGAKCAHMRGWRPSASMSGGSHAWSSADGVPVRSMKQLFELPLGLEPPRSARNSAIVWSGLPRLQNERVWQLGDLQRPGVAGEPREVWCPSICSCRGAGSENQARAPSCSSRARGSDRCMPAWTGSHEPRRRRRWLRPARPARPVSARQCDLYRVTVELTAVADLRTFAAGERAAAPGRMRPTSAQWPPFRFNRSAHGSRPRARRASGARPRPAPARAAYACSTPASNTYAGSASRSPSSPRRRHRAVSAP